jgi:hypothetical protein
MMHRPSTLALVAVTTVLLFAWRHALAQALADLHAGAWGGSLEIGYGLDQERLGSPDASPQTNFARRRIQERLNVRNDGLYFVDPQFFSANLGLTIDLVQDREDSDGVRSSRQSRLIGYAFDSVFFSGLPYNARLYANRTQSLLTQPFGRSDLRFDSCGATLQLREDNPLRELGFPYFSAAAGAQQQRTRETTTSVLGQRFRRDERQNLFSLDGHKGFQTSDLELRYQVTDVSDASSLRSNFSSHTATLHYSLDFGPLLSRRSETRLSLFERSGVSPIRAVNFDEGLQIDHRDNLTTGYRYLFARTAAQGGTATLNSGAFNLRYQPYRNLWADAQTSAQRQELVAGQRDNYAAHVGAQYRYGLPGNGNFSARVSGRSQVDDNRLSASRVDVLDEVHGAPAPLGAGAGFVLNQSFVVVSSIAVTDTRGGSRLPTTPGLDYEIVIEGSLLRIVPLATAAVIRAGDPLAVSYTYELDPSIRYGTTSWSASLGLDYRWISLSYSHEQSDQTILSGRDSRFLQDLRKDDAQIDLSGATQSLSAQGTLAYTRYDSTLLAYKLRRLRLHGSYRPARSVAVGLDADRSLTDFELPAHQTDSRSVYLTLDWYAPSGWSTAARVGQRVYQDSLQATETIDELRLQSRLSYGLLDFLAALTANKRMRASSQTTNWALELSAVRRF